jgi:hypothetical protein
LLSQILAVVQPRLNLRSKPEVERIFKASQHKFKASAFHDACDNRSNTILIAISSNKKVYGGFTTCPWKKDELISYEADADCNSFLWALREG